MPAWPYGARVAQMPRYFSSDVATAVPQGSVAVLYPFPASGDAIPMLWQVAASMRFKSPGGRFVIPVPGSVGTPASDRQTLVGQTFSQLAGGQQPALTPALRLTLRAQLRGRWTCEPFWSKQAGQRPALVLPFFEWLNGGPPDAQPGGINAWYE